MSIAIGRLGHLPFAENRLVLRALGVSGLFAWGYAILMLHGIAGWDQAWFLQVVNRIDSGEVLYRDVFFGSTPFSVDVMVAITRVFGVNLGSLNLLLSLCFTLTAIYCWRIGTQLGAKPAALVLLTMSLAVFAAPLPNSGYSPLAFVFLLVSLNCALSWVKTGKASSALLAASSAGLACASKPNVGLLVLAALLTLIALCMSEIGLASVLRLSSISIACFSVVSTAALIPVLINGGAPQLMDYVLLGKGAYVRDGGVGYLQPLSDFASAIRWPLPPHFYGAIAGGLTTLASVVGLPALVATILLQSGRRRTQGVALLLFTGACLLGLWPRFDAGRVLLSAPELLLVIVFVLQSSSSQIRPSLVRGARFALATALGLGLTVGTGATLARLASPDYTISHLPHFENTLAARSDESLPREMDGLKARLKTNQVFFLSPQAGLLYLISGLRNPTPFDYPFVPAFGKQGEQGLIGLIATGKVTQVCTGYYIDTNLRPRAVEAYVKIEMDFAGDFGACSLYVAREPKPA